MASRTPIIAGNWKMNLDVEASKRLAEALAAESFDGNVEVVLFPTSLAVTEVVRAVGDSNISVGVQNIHAETSGAFTGEVSAPLAKAAGCTWVLIGHSERRQLFHETDEGVRQKLGAVLATDLAPMVCVGETLDERESGRTFDVIGTQVEAVLDGLDTAEAQRVTLAYEPVWAIGTGRTATPEQAEEVHARIRSSVKRLHGPDVGDGMRILYGGSVKPANVAGLMSCENIDGTLVGGASLKADSFVSLVRYDAKNA